MTDTAFDVLTTVKVRGVDIPVVLDPDMDDRGRCDHNVSYCYHVDTPKQIRLREGLDDLDGRVLLHELLHAALSLDPKRVIPPRDPRHEDFVRHLTACLHDDLDYRRAAPQGGNR